jgi:hypothetical protein
MKCSRRIRPIVSTVSIPPTARLESKRAAHQANVQGVNFGSDAISMMFTAAQVAPINLA